MIMEDIDIKPISGRFYADLEYTANPAKKLCYLNSYYTPNQKDFCSLKGGATDWEFDLVGKKRIYINVQMVDRVVFPRIGEGILPKPRFLFTYPTYVNMCPKCSTSSPVGKVYDAGFDPIGRLNVVYGSNKVKQHLLKILLTPLGTNLHDLDYGAETSVALGTKFVSYASASLQRSIHNAVMHLKEIQVQNNLPADETIDSIVKLVAVPNPNSPDTANIIVRVTTVAGEEVEAGVAISGFNYQSYSRT
jgi:phage baseplate assembly protein W